MNIGLFTDTYYPETNGVATSVITLKENLELLGHRVYVITTTDPKASYDAENVFRVPSIPFSAVGRIGLPYQPSLTKKIKELQLDLIHTHTEFSIGIMGRILARKLGIPVVHTLHTLYEDYTHYVVKIHALAPKAKPLARKLSAFFANSANAVIAPTEKMKNLLLDYGVHRPIAVIPTGINLDKFRATNFSPAEILEERTKLGLSAEDQVLVNIGRISNEKNLHELLQALAKYLPSQPKVKLLFVGDGPAKKELENQCQEWNLGKQVVFAGRRPWDKIGLYYCLGNIFVSASQSETQGLTYIEALASGLPVIAKEDPCLEGVVQAGVNGYTFNSQTDFLLALDRVLQDQPHQIQLSKAAELSVQYFTAHYFGQSAAALYTQVLKKGYETVNPNSVVSPV